MPVPTPISYPLINGFRYAFTSIEYSANSIPLKGVKAINYKDSLDPALVMGTSPVPLGDTRGIWSGECSIDIYRLEFEVWKQSLSSSAQKGFGEVVFPMVLVYGDTGMPTITDTLPALRIKGPAADHQQGPDPLVLKVDVFVFAPILWNGVPIVTPITPGGF